MNGQGMNVKIPETVRKPVMTLVKTLRGRGFDCYLVGGSVRDLILRHAVYDFDFATNARPEEVVRLFRKVIPTGIKHGTVSVLLGKNQFEITTYRADGRYLDGRRPEEVTFSKTLGEDVRRRDFTINGLAYDVESGEVIDLVGGLADIERKTIRTIGDPVERFSEDGLRGYRACRFAAKLGFAVEEETLEGIRKTLEVARMVSVERVREELMKLLQAEVPSVGLEYMRQTGLLDLFLPELAKCHGVIQNKYHMYDIYYHSLYSCDAAPRNKPMIRLAALLHDIGKVISRREGEDGDYTFYSHEVIGTKITRKIMKRLKFSNEEMQIVANLILNHMFHYNKEWTDGAVRRFMRKVGLENLEELLALRLADRKGNGMRSGMPAPIRELRKRIEHIIEEANAITVRDLEVDGHMIMDEFRLKPGPVIGKILNELLEVVLDDPGMNKKDILLEKADEIFGRIKNGDLADSPEKPPES